MRADPSAGSAFRLRVVGVAAAATVLLSAGCWIERTEPNADTGTDDAAELTARIAEALDASAAAWNRGDLEGFMSVYLDSASTTYVGRTGLEVGYDAIRDRYAPLFASGADRDSLAFEDLRVRALTDRVAVGTARWVLRDGGRITGSGPFSLVLQRVEGRWKIVHDHSSSDPEPSGGGAGDAESESDDDGG